jgi:hypothetical protein
MEVPLLSRFRIVLGAALNYEIEPDASANRGTWLLLATLELITRAVAELYVRKMNMPLKLNRSWQYCLFLFSSSIYLTCFISLEIWEHYCGTITFRATGIYGQMIMGLYVIAGFLLLVCSLYFYKVSTRMAFISWITLLSPFIYYMLKGPRL